MICDAPESFIRKSIPKTEASNTKSLNYGQHELAFNEVAHIYKDKWYELSLKISEEMWSVCPLLVCKCKNRVENYFGVDFDFEPSYVFNKKSNNMDCFDQGDDRSEASEAEDLPCEALVVADEDADAAELSEQEVDDENQNLAYGLISRLYFFY